ncbi:MAG: hypothetical protein HS108_07530 [Planctomycetes bacterium]|jgi:hypothetical protein|nr:hypothetical protein [Planctomycetota bacterium]MCL4729443.1 hypothetical protein [Planctomycetota bacterium]
MELAVVMVAVGIALAFVGWRVFATLRVARGAGCGGCGSCKPGPTAAGS